MNIIYYLQLKTSMLNFNIINILLLIMYITRKFTKDGHVYSTNSKKDLERIKKLCIPPNWKNVKVDKDKNSKIQVTGYDSKDRKQYIYNKAFVEMNKEKKFNKMNSFDYSKYSRILRYYISKNDLSKKCVMANILKLMEDLNIRVGSENYAKENGSYGITTLLKSHLRGNKLLFIGKKGIEHQKIITDPISISFIKRVLTIKGPLLFLPMPNQ